MFSMSSSTSSKAGSVMAAEDLFNQGQPFEAFFLDLDRQQKRCSSWPNTVVKTTGGAAPLQQHDLWRERQNPDQDTIYNKAELWVSLLLLCLLASGDLDGAENRISLSVFFPVLRAPSDQMNIIFMGIAAVLAGCPLFRQISQFIANFLNYSLIYAL